jgi:hypothetical protein
LAAELLGLLGLRQERIASSSIAIGSRAPVTAGLDFAIELARQIRGEEMPRLFEFVLEYDPKPLFPPARRSWPAQH